MGSNVFDSNGRKYLFETEEKITGEQPQAKRGLVIDLFSYGVRAVA